MGEVTREESQELPMPLRISHTGDAHLDEDRSLGDTARCLEWFVADSISSGTDLFVINGDLTTYKATIRERNLWIDRLIEPEFIELGGATLAVFPYPRKAEMVGDEQTLQEAFARQIEEFNQRFERRRGCYKLFFGHFGVAGARVSSGQPLVGRCAEYPLEPLRRLQAQYVGLSHIHLRQQLALRVWYSGRFRVAITARSKTKATTW